MEEDSNTVDLICARCGNINSWCYVVKVALEKYDIVYSATVIL